MTFKVGDLVVVTGPLKLPGVSIADSHIGLTPGEVGRVLEIDRDASLVCDQDGFKFWIDTESLTLLSEIQDDPEVQWGDLLDPNYVHDYVWDGDYEEVDDE